MRSQEQAPSTTEIPLHPVQVEREQGTYLTKPLHPFDVPTHAWQWWVLMKKMHGPNSFRAREAAILIDLDRSKPYEVNTLILKDEFQLYYGPMHPNPALMLGKYELQQTKRIRGFPATSYIEVQIIKIIEQYLRGKQKDKLAFPGFWSIYTSDQKLAAIVTSEFLDLHQGDIFSFLKGRSESQLFFRTIVEEFARHHLITTVSTDERSSPLLMLQIDDHRLVSDLLQISDYPAPGASNLLPESEDHIQKMCQEYPSLKATKFLILGSEDPNHDYFGYVHSMCEKLAVDVYTFISKQQLHEKIEIATHQLTLEVFKVKSNWFNEGAGEFLADFHERTSLQLSQITEAHVWQLLDDNNPVPRNDTQSDSYFHALAHILVMCISRAINASDSKAGFFEFTTMVFGTVENRRRTEQSFNEVVTDILNENSLREKVSKEITLLLQKFSAGEKWW